MQVHNTIILRLIIASEVEAETDREGEPETVIRPDVGHFIFVMESVLQRWLDKYVYLIRESERETVGGGGRP